MVPNVTLVELVQAVVESADTEAEVLAVVIDMVNRGLVRLAGTFRGCTFRMEEFTAAACRAA